MFYKDAKIKTKHNRTRALRRLWSVDIYDGDKEDPSCPVRTETIIAWNQVDANRKCGGSIANLPKAIGYVTWPRNGESHVYMIENTQDGPIEDEQIIPSIGGVGEDADEWGF